MDKEEKELTIDSFTMVTDAIKSGEIKEIKDKEEKKET